MRQRLTIKPTITTIMLLAFFEMLIMPAANAQSDSVRPEFVDQLKRTDKPQLFFPGHVTKRGKVHFGSSFSDDGSSLIYTITSKGKPGTVVYQEYNNGTFSKPVPIEKDTVYSYSDASLSADGNTIMLASNRPQEHETAPPGKSRLWQLRRKDSGWGNLHMVELEMDPAGSFGYPTTTANKTLYFHYSIEANKPDIYRSEYRNGIYQLPEKLPHSVNTKEFEGDVFVDKQERFIIFSGFNRKDNLGESDLYISFKQPEGWSQALNLGENINSHGYDGSPYVTADDQYLIFTSSRHPEKAGEQEFFNVYYVSIDLELLKTKSLR